MWLKRLSLARKIFITQRITMVLLAGILFYCYEFFLRILTGAYQEQIVNYFQIESHIGFSFLISSYNLTYLLMQIPAGMLLDKYGSKRCLIIATLACGFGNLLFIHGSYIIALCGRLIVGLASSFAFVGVLKLSRGVLPKRYFGLFASVVISLGTLTAAFSQQIGVFLSEYNLLWQEVFIISGALAMPLSIFFWLMIPNTGLEQKLLPDFHTVNQALVNLIKNKLIWLNAVWAGLIYIPTVVITSQYGVYIFGEVYHTSKYQATELITMLLLGWVLFSPIVVLLTAMSKKPNYLSLSFMLLMILSLIALAFFPNTVSNRLSLVVFVFGVFSSVQVLVWQSFNQICPPAVSGVGVALTNMIITLVAEVGQLSSGLLLDFSSHIQYVFHHHLFTYNSQILMLLFVAFIVMGWGVYFIFKHYVRAQVEGDFKIKATSLKDASFKMR